MTRRLRWLAWAAAIATYLLIVLGAVVRITGSGLGCGDDWPVCHGRLFPSFDDLTTLIEWNHRLVAAIVSTLVVLLAGLNWWERRGRRARSTEQSAPNWGGYIALGLLVVQVLLGAITVKLELPPWTVILHLGTALALFAVLLWVALGAPARRPGTAALVAAGWGFVTVLFGGLTANLGAATACVGFPLCNGQLVPAGNYLQHLHWTHRLLAYGLLVYMVVWTLRSRRRGAAVGLGLVVLQIAVAAIMVLLTVPPPLQAAHAAVGAALWGALVVEAVVESRGRKTEAPASAGA
ncbi:MAG TPA: COX15/CtaA family protein [Gemmatimonadales bacterium]|nr:COX15/CtaA family protein [Gemmatimonadales bacterium]